MELNILPFIGVGLARFGMPRDQVRQLLGNRFEEFWKTPQAKATTDDFDALHLHVYYDEDQRCKAIEIFRGATPTLNGKKLIGERFRIVADFLKETDQNIEFTDSGLKSRYFGIALYAPDADEDPDAPVESVYVFKRGIFGT